MLEQWKADIVVPSAIQLSWKCGNGDGGSFLLNHPALCCSQDGSGRLSWKAPAHFTYRITLQWKMPLTHTCNSKPTHPFCWRYIPHSQFRDLCCIIFSVLYFSSFFPTIHYIEYSREASQWSWFQMWIHLRRLFHGTIIQLWQRSPFRPVWTPFLPEAQPPPRTQNVPLTKLLPYQILVKALVSYYLMANHLVI